MERATANQGASLNDLPGCIAITSHGKVDSETEEILLQAFNRVGLKAMRERIEQNTMSPWYDNLVHVIVGRK